MAKTNSPSAWRKKTSLFEPKFIDKEIGGATWRFYPVSVSRLFQLRETIKAVSEACSVLFSKNTDDYEQSVEKITSDQGVIERQSTGAMSPELAKLRASQKRAAVAEAIEALMSDQNKLALGRLLADSLRDDIARDADDAEITEFMDSLDLAQLIEMFLAFGEANAKVFGPLGEKMRATFTTKLRELVGDVQRGAEPEAPSNPAS